MSARYPTTYIRRPFFDGDEARYTKMIIDHTTAQKGADMMIGYLAHIPNQRDWMLQKLGRKRMSAFELSNVGTSTTLRGASNFAIENMLFSQSPSAFSAAIKVSVVTGPDGRLALGSTWQEGAIENGMIAQLKVAVRGEVQGLISST
jgi:hypothetical protein